MANTSILAAFERMWQHVITLVSNKSDSNHNHNDIYFTEEKLNEKLSSKADTTHNHDNDYDAKGASDTALSSAREYTNTSIANLVNSAPETLDTLGELAEAMKANENVVDALDAAITNKVDIVQGQQHAGKILAVDEEGNVALNSAPEAMNITYDDAEQILEFSSTSQLPGNVGVDITLSTSGDAADAKVVGDRLTELEEMIEKDEFILSSPNGTKFQITIGDDGILTATEL